MKDIQRGNSCFIPMDKKNLHSNIFTQAQSTSFPFFSLKIWFGLWCLTPLSTIFQL